jgi:hypothetical protein
VRDDEFPLQNHPHAVAGKLRTTRTGKYQARNSFDEWRYFAGGFLHQFRGVYPCRRLLTYFAERVKVAHTLLLFWLSCQHFSQNWLKPAEFFASLFQKWCGYAATEMAKNETMVKVESPGIKFFQGPLSAGDRFYNLAVRVEIARGDNGIRRRDFALF